jgi:hypothetical protein
MKTAIVVILVLLVAAGCKTGMQQACDGHGGVSGYANGQSHCADGTWQS